MKDIDLDAEGNPVILVVTSNDHKPGPSGEPRIWTIAHWAENQWAFPGHLLNAQLRYGIAIH